MIPIDQMLPMLVLAFGAAMVFGYGLALIRPPSRPQGEPAPGESPPGRAPLARSLLMVGIGLVGALWALATLLS